MVRKMLTTDPLERPDIDDIYEVIEDYERIGWKDVAAKMLPLFKRARHQYSNEGMSNWRRHSMLEVLNGLAVSRLDGQTTSLII